MNLRNGMTFEELATERLKYVFSFELILLKVSSTGFHSPVIRGLEYLKEWPKNSAKISNYAVSRPDSFVSQSRQIDQTRL